MSEMRFRTGQIEGVPKLGTGQISVQFDVPKKDVPFQYLAEFWDKYGTVLGQVGHLLGQDQVQAKCLTLGCPVPKSRQFLSDATDLSEKDFMALLKTITNLDELEGFANRREVLRAPHLKRYSALQRELILQRKWEIENG
jgi:hypothetical protein